MAESKSASVVFTNSSLLAKNAQVTADSAKTAAEVAQKQAITAQRTADGKNSIYRGADPATVPTAGLKEGDLYFTDNALYTWTGTSWEKTVSDITGAEIHSKVEKAMAESQKLVVELKSDVEAKTKELDDKIKKTQGQTGFFIGTTPPQNPAKGMVWATTDSSGNMTSAKTWNGSSWVSTAFTQDLVAGNITATKIQGGELDINKITVKNAQNIPITSTVSLGQKLSYIEQEADSINAYVKGSKGSKILESILSMDPDHSSIAQVVNGQIAAAIGTYSDGTVRIDGKALHINAQTKIDDATIKSAMIDSIEADKITTGTLNADKVNIINLNADKITSGTLNGMTITGSTFIATGQQTVLVNDSGFEVGSMKGSKAKLYAGGLEITTDNNDSLGERLIDLVILDKDAGPYIKIRDEKKDSETHISSGIIQTPDARIGPIHISYHHIRSDNTIWISNDSDSNFNNQGSVGLQIEAGVGLGENTIYTYTNDLYIQKGLVVNQELYSRASKTTIHCQKVISQVANTVSSRLSVKTDITPVTYDRALAAVEGTEMYDYRYISDDSGQHYVSGIIDDVNPDPQYHMDDMLINKERTARIDSNLVGYHHVVIQKLLERVAALEEKVK
jgi:hypothetical protein|nr:MAG TPA: minor structural protein [Caudoviricetes sp.]